MEVKFEWDRRKASANERKHGVSFDEAMSVFNDPLARIFDDEDHSTREAREIIIGTSARQRLLVISFVARREIVRLINARKGTRREREDYEKNAGS
jgi:uncharacterized protein